MEDERRYCSMCHCELSADEDYEVDGQQLCESCFEEHTTTCDHCGETIWASDSICDDRTTLCTCCYDDHYRRCEECGRILHDDDVLWCHDLPYCANCYDRLDTEIEEYGYKPEPIFYGDGTRFFGVELEVDCGGKDEDNARRIKAQANTRCENIYCKSDGSLDDGFEIVTHPMTLGYHMNEMYWEDVLHEAVSLGYRSHMTSTCGLHVHVNRDAFGEDHDEQERVIERILYFVELHWNELFIFSRRSQHNMQRWAARYGMEKTGKEILDKAKKGNNGRYAAINLCPYQTIEFRLFRGTLKLNTLYATLQLVNKLCDPMTIFMMPPRVRPELVMLSAKDQYTLEQYIAAHHNLETLGIAIAKSTGLRVGELCALQWKNVDLDKRILTVTKTIQRIQVPSGNGKTKLIITDPKSASSCRKIPIPAALFPLLLEFADGPDIYVIAGRKNPVEPRTVQYRFTRILKDAGLPIVNFHALRHMFATNCIKLGFDMKTLSELLGHSSVEITMKVYVHSSMEQKAEYMDRLTMAI